MNEIIAKLFVSVIAMTDTGSIAVTGFTTDLPLAQCQRLSNEFNAKTDLKMQGHDATISVKSFCDPIRGYAGGPPPVADIAGMLNGFINGLPRN